MTWKHNKGSESAAIKYPMWWNTDGYWEEEKEKVSNASNPCSNVHLIKKHNQTLYVTRQNYQIDKNFTGEVESSHRRSSNLLFDVAGT